MNLIPGDVVFVMHKNEWVSRAIAWFMKSRWSHSAIVVDKSVRETYLVETSDYEVTIGLMSRYENDPNTEYEVWRFTGLMGSDQKKVWENVSPLLRQTYGYLQLISLGVRRLLMRVGVRVPNFFRQGLVCCHVVGYAFLGTNVKMLNILDPESFDTQELYEMLPAYGFTKIYERKSG